MKPTQLLATSLVLALAFTTHATEEQKTEEVIYCPIGILQATTKTDSEKDAAVGGLMTLKKVKSEDESSQREYFSGEIKIKSGSVTVEGDALKGGQFIIDMTTLENKDLSGEWKAKIEGHLHTEDFFHTEKHPEAKLEIINVEGSGVGVAKVSANLTIKEITKNITFNADVTEISDATFKATADFNIVRADWGIVYPGMPDDLISAEINFKVSIVANK